MGIDYGMGQTNIDRSTGIRYGVLPMHEVMQAWSDSSEPDYGEPCCPNCGNPVIESSDDKIPEDSDLAGNKDYVCIPCDKAYWSDRVFGDEPLEYVLDDDEYKASQGDSGDIFILKSPYYTLCDFCSPCAPGAGYLLSEGVVKAYCFDHDWFHDHPEHPNIAPYKVFRVVDDVEVLPENME